MSSCVCDAFFVRIYETNAGNVFHLLICCRCHPDALITQVRHVALGMVFEIGALTFPRPIRIFKTNFVCQTELFKGIVSSHVTKIIVLVTALGSLVSSRGNI